MSKTVVSSFSRAAEYCAYTDNSSVFFSFAFDRYSFERTRFAKKDFLIIYDKMTKQSGTFLERFFTDLNQIPSKRKRQFEKACSILYAFVSEMN